MIRFSKKKLKYDKFLEVTDVLFAVLYHLKIIMITISAVSTVKVWITHSYFCQKESLYSIVKSERDKIYLKK